MELHILSGERSRSSFKLKYMGQNRSCNQLLSTAEDCLMKGSAVSKSSNVRGRGLSISIYYIILAVTNKGDNCRSAPAQLLSTEDKGVVKGSAKSKSSDVRVTQPFKSSSAPAQSTSINIELAQQPHQSCLQKPQSRLTLPLH
ncbi:hypothetical protein DPMN_020623 [Dreissena polymorpha]|uniref:Uncharacterized protein n=1 Tax=Dreissena polymorpha TaxID=45954 RepID=A0A9D4S976_DREPO|nr:hypothetical protein DPMN_020623 [Dreissena polymorpha]